MAPTDRRSMTGRPPDDFRDRHSGLVPFVAPVEVRSAVNSGRYTLASTTSTQSYTAIIGAVTVQLLAKDAASRQTDNLEAFATPAVVEQLKGVAANSDRRRLGRIDDVSPTLILLLRSNAVAKRIFEVNFENDLRPAIGIIAALILSVLIWGVITFLAWCFLRR